jgi:hypothetical protein
MIYYRADNVRIHPPPMIFSKYRMTHLKSITNHLGECGNCNIFTFAFNLEKERDPDVRAYCIEVQ